MSQPDHLYLSILKGPNPQETTPLFASEDPLVIRAAVEAVARACGLAVQSTDPDARVLSLLTDGDDSGEEQGL